MSEADDKVLENRLRRMLQRRGYQLIKSRRRDPRAIDYGGYMIATRPPTVWSLAARPTAFR
jgi:hypothetical protein